MKKFVPEYHEGIQGGVYYAIPGRYGGTRVSSGGKVGKRCYAVYRNAYCINEPFDTYDEANDRAMELATTEVLALNKAKADGWSGRPLYIDVPGIVDGYLEDEEVAA